jgi:hypothetical protein
MNIHDKDWSQAQLIRRDIDAYMNRARQQRSEVIAAGGKRAFAVLSRGVQRLLRAFARGSHTPCATPRA